MPNPGTQKGHAVTTRSNSVKKESTYNDTAPLSPETRKSLLKEIDKIIADSKIKAKQESDKRNAPKTNWITKL